MDTDEFLKRCEDIELGLNKLADNLYRVMSKGITGEERESYISQSKEKIRKYDEFISELDDDDDIQEANEALARGINHLKSDLLQLESE